MMQVSDDGGLGYRLGFPNPGTDDIWDRVTLCCGTGLGTAVYLAASLASTLYMSVARC